MVGADQPVQRWDMYVSPTFELRRSEMRILTALFLGVALSATGAFAEECKKLEKQQEKNECYSKQLPLSEKALSDTYKVVLGRLQDRPDTLTALELAQEAWKVYRDAECLFSASGSAGGSAYVGVLAECKDDLTDARVKKLNTYLHCKEGDPACPVPGP
ncbi:MAG TPA: lysozyme inhibitor LprI family protein [Roseiarcus sp.]|nr:lysozyme inhibitor LprI family protein [Roseiarcus sp.]